MAAKHRRGVPRPSHVALAFGLLFAGPVGAAAQEAEPTRVWAAVGFGGGSVFGGDDDDGGLAASIQIAAQRGPHQLTLRLAGVTDIYYADDSFADVGLLYGRAASSGFAHASASAGIALASGPGCSGTAPECSTEHGIGIPFAAEVAIRPLSVLGIGLQLFGDVSTVGSMLGVLGMVQLGWMP